ncbi:MAG: hypothetical protein ACK559_04885, partial [bacterium]
ARRKTQTRHGARLCPAIVSRSGCDGAKDRTGSSGLEAAEPALERHAVGRAVAEAQLRLVQRQLVEAHAAQDGALAVQLRAADERLRVLGSQLRLSREAESA